MIRYAKPTTVNEALALLGEGQWRLLAGGTDFYPALGNRPLRENVLDINGLDELRDVSETAAHIIVGARTTWSDIVARELPPAFDALKEAAREVGSIQIQNTGTVVGNLCNASPAADGVPALMILDAEVEVSSHDSVRHLPLRQFILGNRRTALRPAEMVTAIRVPKVSTAGSSSFFKLGARRYLVISIAMAAARIVVRDGVIEDAAISVGACSEVAQRLDALESALRGRSAQSAPDIVEDRHLGGLQPIDDVRGSTEYRRAAAREIVVRVIEAALEKAVPAGQPATVAA
ncbi:FAD binding domain-containing protein [Mesorhizobium sp. ZC-5]|uniref:FAD binding domain-containing protein n=1 Tax=Mesorhizobium sp. ZC-5 TaxID=2986066 RepID=UPI0021E8FF85|nr:xanthine dehydrogenase family protein subunit M [Mesorhizobium sp. ZC-5]MCV3239438.1 xanthine dehydrogenase family protein subunit M [Mesorhizobium sp. ZC-5]